MNARRWTSCYQVFRQLIAQTSNDTRYACKADVWYASFAREGLKYQFRNTFDLEVNYVLSSLTSPASTFMLHQGIRNTVFRKYRRIWYAAYHMQHITLAKLTKIQPTFHKNFVVLKFRLSDYVNRKSFYWDLVQWSMRSGCCKQYQSRCEFLFTI